MIYLEHEEETIILALGNLSLKAHQENQLSYWGFSFNEKDEVYTCRPDDPLELIVKLISFLDKFNLQYSLSEKLVQEVETVEKAFQDLERAKIIGRDLKNGTINVELKKELDAFLNVEIKRKLKDHQIKAVMHLLATQNGANFSVPGSGKTTVVLTAHKWLKNKGIVDSLFVVGPPACFAPWRNEYKEVLGKNPTYEMFAGGDINTRHSKYLVDNNSVADLYLITFQTLQKDWENVQLLLKQKNIKFFLVIDEAHYIKQVDGAWANAALNISRYSSRRCILTGTPFPRNYTDAFNLFEFLWPDNSPFSELQKNQISHYEKNKDYQSAANILEENIGPLFYRVRKSDLGLADQIFIEPTLIEMNQHEKYVYDSIVDRVKQLSQEDYIKNLDVLLRLRRGRMMRLRQCISYTPLLATAISEYSENLLSGDRSLTKIIKNYDSLELPAKLEKLFDIVEELHSKNEKVVIWSNFIRTLELIKTKLDQKGYGVRLIYGGTPVENQDISEELTRERIIRDFIDPSSGINILVANPAACAESISLHKTCSFAIYYDMSYNCAQYLQSLDRIHRVGGSEKKRSFYYFLQYADTMDQDILENVRRKADNMSTVIDKEYAICSHDMFSEEEELDAYERIFGN